MHIGLGYYAYNYYFTILRHHGDVINEVKLDGKFRFHSEKTQ